MDTEIRVTSCAGLGWIALWVFFILMSMPSRGQFYQLQTNLKDLVEVQRSILEEMKSQISSGMKFRNKNFNYPG